MIFNCRAMSRTSDLWSAVLRAHLDISTLMTRGLTRGRRGQSIRQHQVGQLAAKGRGRLAPQGDTLVPVEQIYASLLTQCGFHNAASKVLRKRNSKKELFEFGVPADWP